MSVYSEIFRARSEPLQPIPAGAAQRLMPLNPVRCVLLDVYGTMFISGSGDVGVAAEAGEAAALAAACQACGYHGRLDAARGVKLLLETIAACHRRERDRGLEYPEVEIVEIWERWWGEMVRRGWLAAGGAGDMARLAVEYEVRVNPAWPMPGLQEVLRQLRGQVTLGIISNAQFFTVEMFAGLLGQTPEQAGFDPDLQVYSYHYRRAKPDPFLYQLAAHALAKRGLAAREILYIGNDMLNDIQPARAVGFRTGLFAGDARSLRWREGDRRVSGVRPDVVLTELSSIARCISGSVGAE